ncbi:MAG: MotA/TolQ/ExbB proton channel family protein [Alphaproteobacteria bacterium]|uniref:MotA/TolQ/ExbB proton channel family protein n=1 Tax=Candidatus Nitrobium versatile TaxID=2884831 RepID=A0A953J4L2_9BACT|nr:MotA/TolQ/ExbB proton channel family protein [Candidatus Nitrobium versatile]
MNILAGLETFLYIISSALFFPVVAGLVLLTFWMIIALGGFLREWIERRRGVCFPVDAYRETLEAEARTAAAGTASLLGVKLERLLQIAELELVKSLDRVRFAIRVGPALGLMGTLIPMGISLSALAQGDMPKMAGSMVTAFTATVVGLACGIVAYLMSLAREKWVRADMREMEYLTELALGATRGNTTITAGELDTREVYDEVSEETETV